MSPNTSGKRDAADTPSRSKGRKRSASSGSQDEVSFPKAASLQGAGRSKRRRLSDEDRSASTWGTPPSYQHPLYVTPMSYVPSGPTCTSHNVPSTSPLIDLSNAARMYQQGIREVSNALDIVAAAPKESVQHDDPFSSPMPVDCSSPQKASSNYAPSSMVLDKRHASSDAALVESSDGERPPNPGQGESSDGEQPPNPGQGENVQPPSPDVPHIDVQPQRNAANKRPVFPGHSAPLLSLSQMFQPSSDEERE
ncbi:uncharacterized protein B0T23DRAFT_325478 [Neurospora hispaniola]|uniref:Uncharacterized protein n=1 Tax=Neurospora hispaniola TaxID=588809 RepID=A0AAJ0HZ69_9PEZI|nr:hypothetical protein B0T23DRAFT_325478 [Neurospora hispaniola]